MQYETALCCATQPVAALKGDRWPLRLCLSTLAVGFAFQLSARAQVSSSPLQASHANSAEQRQHGSAARKSQVTYTAGLLTVIANNDSLDGIIHEVARQSGMKISGSVAEDRVFGTYGPADPQKVLAALLDGTGSNFLIVSTAADAPAQLVLTPRIGGATPPNPNASANNQEDDTDAPIGAPPPGAGFEGNAPRARAPFVPGSVPANPAATQPSTTEQPVVFPPADTTSAPATGTTSPVDPNNPADPSTESVKTPQQIFEQLQKLRQQHTGSSAPQ